MKMITRKWQVCILSAFLAVAAVSCVDKKPEPVPEPEPEPVVNPEPDPTPPPAPEPVKTTLRIMQFNILQSTSETAGHEWTAVRKAPSIKMLQETAPDILCLEEARRLQCDDLKSALPEYTQIRFAKDGVLKDGLQESFTTDNFKNGGQRNVVMFKTDRFEYLDAGRFWFSVDGTASGNRFDDDATTQKLTLFVHLKDKVSGKDFRVYCTHFFAKCNKEETRANCVRMSLESMQKEAKENETVLFCGDLNLDYKNAEARNTLKPLLDYAGSAALLAKESSGAETTTYNKFGTSTKVLDYILLRNASAPVYKVVDEDKYGTRYVSDHYPLYADVEF